MVAAAVAMGSTGYSERETQSPRQTRLPSPRKTRLLLNTVAVVDVAAVRLALASAGTMRSSAGLSQQGVVAAAVAMGSIGQETPSP